MATVPLYRPTERLAPNYRADFSVRATPEDFGAAKGRALEQVANSIEGVGRVVSAVQAKEDEARAKEADNAFSDALRNEAYGENGFMLKSGKTAVEAWPGYQKRVEELRLQFGKGLTGEAAKMYQDVSKARVANINQSGIVHTGSERKTWFRDASQARVSAFENDALSGYTNPATVEKGIAGGLSELQQRAADEGWDADTLKAKGLEYSSSIRRNVVLRLAEDDPLKADAYFKQHKDRMSGADQFAVGKALEEGLAIAKGQANADRILKSGTTGAPPAGSEAMSAIRGHEGFSATAYWDVNAWRTGYGSDTVTRADGSIEKVTRSTVVTREDAERDLARRTKEFQGGVISKIGNDAWGKLPAGAQAALTSVAYNYGGIPDSVASAARTGDPAAIAKAIQARGGDNGGINRGRRNREAAMAMGGGMGSSAPDFMSMQQQIEAIKDPKEREATRRYLNATIEAQGKAQEAAKKQAELQLFSAVEQGGTPDDVPLETRLMAGQASVSSAWSYHEARLKRGEPQTNEVLLYQLRRSSAIDPEGFSRVNLMEYRDQLDNAAFKELTDNQTSALKSSGEALQTGKIYADAYKMSEQQLDAVGLTVKGITEKEDTDGTKRQEMNARIATFQNALKDQIDIFRLKNDNRLPSYAEQQAIINQMLVPIVAQQDSSGIFGGLFGGDEKQSFAFDIPQLPAETAISVKPQDIPNDIRFAIETDLQRELGRKPSPDEIADWYRFVFLGQAPSEGFQETVAARNATFARGATR